MKPLTPREGEVLAYIKAHVKRYECAPTRLEIGQELGMSRPTAELHLQRIRDKGYIVLRTQWRGIFLKAK